MSREEVPLKRIELHDIYKFTSKADIYKKLIYIGDEVYPAIQYANTFVIEKDPLASAHMRVIDVGYYFGIVSFMQLEHGLFFVSSNNLEYCTAIILRSMLELAGRVHKAVRMYKEKQQEEFIAQSNRLTMPYVRGGGGGFNIMTMVQSLEDKIPDIMDYYDHLSEYLHGDILLHSAFREVTLLHTVDDSTPDEVRSSLYRPSPIIEKYMALVDTLHTVLLEDLEVVKTLAAPYAAKYRSHTAGTGPNGI